MKVVTKKIKNTDEYSIIRYSISGMIVKTIIFIILYIIYTYLGIYNFGEILSSKIIIKYIIIRSLPFFIFLYSEVILTPCPNGCAAGAGWSWGWSLRCHPR